MEPGRLGRAVGDAIAGLMGASSRRPGAAIGVVLLVSSFAVLQLADVRFEENLIQILPRGNPNTEANLNVSTQFPGHHTYTALILKTDEAKWAVANRKLPYRTPPEQIQEQSNRGERQNGYVGANNISDEVYVRGMDELFRFYESNAPEGVTVFVIAWNSHVKLVNWSNEKAQRAPGTNVDYAFSMPDTSPAGERQYQIDWETVMRVAPTEVTTQASPKWDAMRAVFTYEPPSDRDMPLSELGAWFERTTEAYRQAGRDGKLRWDVFDLEAVSIFDSKVVVDAHQNELAKRNLSVLGPLVAIMVLASLWLAFRNWRPLAIGTASLVMGVVWTFGLMAFFDIPLNVLNLTVVPLILGVGIDFSIHILNEFAVLKQEGREDVDAFREVGRRGGFSIFLATVTTIAGLVVMIFSPSLLIAQLGIVASLALAVVYVLSVVFIPAAMRLLGSEGLATQYRPSALMPRVARAVGRNRGRVTAAVLVASVLFLGLATFNDYETFGNPARNFPASDGIRQQQETANRLLYARDDPDQISNWIIIEGDITQPAVHDYIRDLSRDLARSDRIRDDSVVSLHNLIGRWVAIKNGSPAALLNIAQETAQPQSTYPNTPESIKRNLDEIYDSPFATYASLFVNRDYTITVILIDLVAGTDYAQAQTAWDEVWQTIDGRADRLPPSARVAMGGYTAFSVLFIKYEMPWVQYMSVVTTAVVALLVLVLTRSLRATLAVTALNVLTSAVWLGLLPLFGIGLSVTLTMPLIFIYCIGSDYALHLAMDLRRGAGLFHSFSTVGKAVLFSAATDLGAFALFVPMENLMMRKSMLATCIAIAAIFVLTLLVVPLFYPERAAARTRRAVAIEPPAANTAAPSRAVPARRHSET